jgi:hypothetical protein
MPVYQIPPEVDRFEIARGRDGSFLVVSETSGTRGVVIPCRDEAQATDVCARLNRRDHAGEIDVPLFGLPSSRDE